MFTTDRFTAILIYDTTDATEKLKHASASLVSDITWRAAVLV
jgi:hypothetical protein